MTDPKLKDLEDNTWYATTYCNRAHRMRDGKPIGHECHVLPPEALRAERDGDTEHATELLAAARKLGKLSRIHRGVTTEES